MEGSKERILNNDAWKSLIKVKEAKFILASLFKY